MTLEEEIDIPQINTNDGDTIFKLNTSLDSNLIIEYWKQI